MSPLSSSQTRPTPTLSPTRPTRAARPSPTRPSRTGGEDGDTSAEEEEGEEEEEEEAADQLTYGKAEVLLDEKLAALKNEVFTKINQSAAAVIAEVKKIAKAEPAASGQSPATNKATTPAQKRPAAPVAATSSGARPVRARTPARKPE